MYYLLIDNQLYHERNCVLVSSYNRSNRTSYKQTMLILSRTAVFGPLVIFHSYDLPKTPSSIKKKQFPPQTRLVIGPKGIHFIHIGSTQRGLLLGMCVIS